MYYVKEISCKYMYKDKTYRNVDNRQNKHAHYGDEENKKKKKRV